MTPFILYQLKIALGIALFTSLYFLLFRKETFYRSNRMYLLLSLVIPVVLPLIKIPDINPSRVSAVSELIGSVTSVTIIPEASATRVNPERLPLIVLIYRIMMVFFSF